jgi:uncharacterized protein involved in exopolysaccharide biosynthesis
MRYKIDFNHEEIIKSIKSKYFLITIFFSLIVSLSFFLIKEKEFTSNSSILIPSTGMSQNGGILSLANQFGFSLDSGKDNLINPIVIKKIAKNKELISTIFKSQIEINGESLTTFKHLFPDLDIQDAKDFEKATKSFIKNNLNIYQDLEGPIVNIQIVTKNAVLSFQICELILVNIVDKINSLKTAKSNDTLEFIGERLISVQNELEQKEENLEKFLETNNAIQSPSLQTQFNKLSSEVDIVRQIYISLRTEEQVLSVEIFDKNNKIFILEKPSIPATHSFPTKRYFMFLFLSLNVLFIIFLLIKNSQIRKIDF